MKLLFKSLFVVLTCFLLCLKSEALKFSEAYEQSTKKPMVLLVYADWAQNYEEYINVMQRLEKVYGDRLNFVELNIADSDAAVFNEKFHIYPNLPYILLFRDGGKVSRYVQRNCAIDYSCTESKIKVFIQ